MSTMAQDDQGAVFNIQFDVVFLKYYWPETSVWAGSSLSEQGLHLPVLDWCASGREAEWQTHPRPRRPVVQARDHRWGAGRHNDNAVDSCTSRPATEANRRLLSCNATMLSGNKTNTQQYQVLLLHITDGNRQREIHLPNSVILFYFQLNKHVFFSVRHFSNICKLNCSGQ